MRVKASQLRAGNLLIKNGVVVELDAVAIGYIVDYSSDYESIPLTFGLLRKCGFTGSEKEYGGFVSRVVNGNAFRLFVNANGQFYYMTSKYSAPTYVNELHRLQNLFFNLLGEELKINI